MAQIIATASGKGGVGKSFISSSLSLSLTRAGHSVLLVDGDLGGANLHTFLGLKVPGVGLYNFLKERADIEEVIVKSPAGVDFIGGSGDILGMAHISNFEKVKIFNRLRELKYDYIIIDLGAGTSFNMVDFFNLSDLKLVVMNSEPTSVENAYGFLKIAVYRYIERTLSKDDRFEEVCKKLRSKSMNFPGVPSIRETLLEIGPDVVPEIDHFIASFRPGMVLNMVKKKKELNVFYGFDAVTKKYLSIHVEKLGFIPYDIQVSEHIKQVKPFYALNPESDVSGCVDDVRDQILAKL